MRDDPPGGRVPAPHRVRRATDADVAAVVDVLARAFDDDPVACYLFPDDERRRRALPRFFGIQLRRMYLDRGEVWTTDDVAGAALWGTPDMGRPTMRDLWHLAPMLRHLAALGRGLGAAARLLGEIDRARPRAPHWYLATLGTDPPRQGTGIGSAVLAPVLSRLDAEGLPAYLESSKERNLAFYGRHRFEVVREVRVDGSPPVWTMWREPRPPET